jgi:hypothetical protein
VWPRRKPHSVDAPAGCRLTSFHAAGPNPEGLTAIYQRCGMERADKQSLRARIAGPKGTLELT